MSVENGYALDVVPQDLTQPRHSHHLSNILWSHIESQVHLFSHKTMQCM